MLSYVTYDWAGALTGGYLQELAEQHEACHIEASDEQRMNWPRYRASVDRTSVEPIDPPAVDLDALRGRLAAAVDDRIAGIYLRWTRFETEYTEREAAARAYVMAEYQGECSPWVTSFASPAGLTLAAAADRIVAQADSLRAALGLLGALRMRKYEITRAADAAAAQVEHDAIMIEADTIEGALQ